jgi:hypothetical protein
MSMFNRAAECSVIFASATLDERAI